MVQSTVARGNSHLTEISLVGSAMIGKSMVTCRHFHFSKYLGSLEMHWSDALWTEYPRYPECLVQKFELTGAEQKT